MAKTTRSPAVFLILFGLVFAVPGLIVCAMGLSNLGKTKDGAIPAIGGLPFALVGLGLVAGGFGARNYYRRQAALASRYPDEPWRHRADWAEGTVHSSDKLGLLGLAGFTLFWNAVAWPITVVMFVSNKSVGWAWLVLLFPGIGVIMATVTVGAFLRYLRWGESVLRLEPFPPRLGNELVGAIVLKQPLQPSEPTRVTVRCERVVTEGSGDNRKTVRHVLWEDARHLAPHELPGQGMQVPVRMTLPIDQPVFTQGSTPRIEWTLDVTTRLRGPNFHGVYKLPVCEALEGAPPVGVRKVEPESAERALAYEDPSIVVTPLASSIRIDFPRGRHKGLSLFLLLFSVVFICVGGGIGIFGRTHSFMDAFILLFPLVFGGIGLLMLYIGLHLLVAWSRITVSRGSIELESKGLLQSKHALISASDITTLIIKSNASVNQTQYYDIELTTITGEKYSLGRTIKGKPAAQGLLDRINKALGRASNLESATTAGLQ